MAQENVSGLDLSRRFYRDMVRPLLESRWPGLRHSAALIGPGSEVLGFDDEMSRDHHWGPRVLLFLEPPDRAALQASIRDHLAAHLPCSCLGYPTHFTEPDPDDNGTQLLEEVSSGPVRHRAEITDLPDFLQRYLGIRDWRALGARALPDGRRLDAHQPGGAPDGKGRNGG